MNRVLDGKVRVLSNQCRVECRVKREFERDLAASAELMYCVY